MPAYAALPAGATRWFQLAMVTNQDGLGSETFPQPQFDIPHQFMLDAFSSQGVEFDAVFVCPHRKADGCDCRKPKTKLVENFVRERKVDLAASAMIGDRETDMEFARNLGVRGLLVRRHGNKWETWPSILRELTERSATIRRTTKETDIHVTVNLDNTAPITIATDMASSISLEQIAKHGGSLEPVPRNRTSANTTVEDCAGACETLRTASAAGRHHLSGFVSMDRAQVRIAPSIFQGTACSKASSPEPWADCPPNWCRISSVAGRKSRRGSRHHRRRERTT
jgi:histidinol-phosphatase